MCRDKNKKDKCAFDRAHSYWPKLLHGPHVFTVSSAKHGVARATDAEPRGKQRATDKQLDYIETSIFVMSYLTIAGFI